MNDSPPPKIEEIVDLDRYPVGDIDATAARRVLERCRRELQTTGATQLEGFVRPAAVEQILIDAAVGRPHAHRTESTHNVYFTPADVSGDADDPRRALVRSAKYAIGFDRLGGASALRALYEWDGLTALVRSALGLERLYRDSDPVGACSIMVYDEGDELGWHFDNSEFAVTLMLAPSGQGGSFEYVPRLRSDENENYEAVRALLAGGRNGVRTMDGAAGTLALFQGRYSIHRVTPIRGATPRINAVLAYASAPEHKLTQETRELFYGATGV